MNIQVVQTHPDVAVRLERLPMSLYQRSIFLIIGTAFLFDTMDTSALAFMLGTIRSEFGLSPAETGLLASASLLGMFFGAGSAGVLADIFGRKPIFQFSMIIWGIGSVLCGLSQTYLELASSRVLLGIGMGMELPIALTLVAEFLPTQIRGRYTAILEGFLPIGFICVGLLIYFLMPVVGWRGIFFILAAPALFLLAIRRAVPESPRWLEARGRHAEAERIMGNVEQHVKRFLKVSALPPYIPNAIIVRPSKGISWRSAVHDLWQPEYRKITAMLWVIWFVTLLGFYGLTSWTAALLQQSGYDVSKSILYTVIMSTAGIPGFACSAWALEKWGRKPAAIAFLLGGAVSAFLYGYCSSHHYPVEEVIAAGLLMQFFLFGMWCVIYAYTPELYPTRSRTTGSGIASSVGRIGSIVGPYGIGLLLPIVGQNGAFAVGAICYVIAAITIGVAGRETKGIPLD